MGGKGGNREARCCEAEDGSLAGEGLSKVTTEALASDKLWASFQKKTRKPQTPPHPDALYPISSSRLSS